MEATETRKAEFARLFELFERLTNRASRKSHAPEQVTPVTAEASKPFAVPADLALPAIRNLASIVSNDKVPAQQRAQNITASSPGGADLETTTTTTTEQATEATKVVGKEKESGYKFPVGPFTFKMMLHKLYGLEEWARKVKEVLEKSRQNYRSLSEADPQKKPEAGCESQRGQVYRKLSQKSKARSNQTVADGSEAVRARRDSSNAAAKKNSCVAGSVVRRAMPAAPNDEGRTEERVIKKRCVGGQKSDGGKDACEPEDTWVYDSAVVVVTEAGNTSWRVGSSDGNRKNALITFAFPEADGRDDGLIYSSSVGQTTNGMGTVQRERALSEVRIKHSGGSPRKRPYLC